MASTRSRAASVDTFHDPRKNHLLVFQAWLTFAVWDIARRAHLGIDPQAYRRQLGVVLQDSRNPVPLRLMELYVLARPDFALLFAGE